MRSFWLGQHQLTSERLKLSTCCEKILLNALLFGNNEPLEEHRMVTGRACVPTSGAATYAYAEGQHVALLAYAYT